MNKQEILNEINKTKEHLANLAKKLEEVSKTREQAKAEAEKILVRRMLEDIARRLNKGKKIDWNDGENKYCIALGTRNYIITECNAVHKLQGVVYCLDNSFRNVAIQEIGEERLKKYLRGE